MNNSHSPFQIQAERVFFHLRSFAFSVCVRVRVCLWSITFRINCKEIKSIQNGKFASSYRFSPFYIYAASIWTVWVCSVCGCIGGRGHQVIHTMITNNFRIINIVINYAFVWHSINQFNHFVYGIKCTEWKEAGEQASKQESKKEDREKGREGYSFIIWRIDQLTSKFSLTCNSYINLIDL